MTKGDLKHPFEAMLQGGDLRSLGHANKVLALVNDQAAFDSLFELLQHPDRIVAMRASDVVEKITLEHPAYLSPHKKDLLNICKTTHYPEVKWHLALIVPRIQLSKKEIGMAWDIFTNWATNLKEGRIARVNSVQGMYELLKQYKDLQIDFDVTINEIYRENIPSLNARIRMLRKGKPPGK